MMNHEKTVLRENEIRRLETCLREPEFRGLLLEYVRDLKENAPAIEKEMKAHLSSSSGDDDKGSSVEFLHPQAGFVLHSSGVYINLCSESKVSRPSEGDKAGSWCIPYAIPPSRRHLLDGETVTLYDILFHPFALKKAIKNRRFKTALKETAISAVVQADPTLNKESFSILPNVSYVGRPKSILMRPKSPQYTLKYREAKDPFGGQVGLRPEAALIEIHLPEFPGAANIDLDVTRRSLTLRTKDPVPYHLHVPFSYPVNEEKGNAKFEKSTRKLLVSIPILPSKKMERLLSVDSGIDEDESDVPEDAHRECSSSTHESEDEPLLDTNCMMCPPFRYDLNDDILSMTLDVKNVEASSIVKTPFSQEHLSGYRIAFSSVGAGLVRYDFSFAFALQGSDHLESLKEPSLDLWDNNMTIDVYLSSDHTELLIGKTLQELKVQSNPSLEVLRSSQKTEDKLQKEHLKMESSVEREEGTAEGKDRHSFGESVESVDSARESGRFSVTPLDSAEEESLQLPPLPGIRYNTNSSIRGILKRRVRSYSESQADQLRRWEEAISYLPTHMAMQEEEDFVPQEEEESNSISDSYGKKSVRFNDTVQRQIFRQNASILGQRQKNMKKNEQKKRKNALRQRRASEGDAQKGDEGSSLSDSGVEEVFSTAEDTEEDSSSEASAKRQDANNNERKNSSLANLFELSEQLMFELDIE